MTLAVRAQSFESLRASWNNLLQHSAGGSIFSSWEFQTAWYETFGQGLDLHLWQVVDGDVPIGIAPLMQQDRRICFVGAQDVCDYLDFLILAGREREGLSAVLDHLETLSWDQMELISLREGSPTLAHLPALSAAHGWQTEVVKQDVCPQLPLPGDWDAYLSALSKKDRHEIRRKLRRLQSTDAAHCYLGSSPSADMETFLTLHRQSNEDKAEFMTEQMEQFFRRLADTFDLLGQYGMYLMEVDGLPVSAAMCFFTPTEVLLYNSGFRRDYGHLSVGLLLKAYCICDAIQRRIPAFNFLRGDEPYKYHLGGQDEPVYNMTVRRV
ncbi:MAG: GNAT family N-acetyltransferase [Bacteroidetes bacterium]|nr:GNAT family N-acetyltransferase [Bacteroidota bacterium]MCL5026657.1 GNAT family N-acetyltransferase [Chloroflexota bacterium]